MTVEPAPAEMLLRVPFRAGHSIRLEAPEVGWTSIMLPPTIHPTQAELLERLQRLLAEDVDQVHVEVDEALLRRLNDLDADLRWVRLLWIEGQVLCETEVAHDVTAQDLRQACITVATATRMTRGLFNDTAH